MISFDNNNNNNHYNNNNNNNNLLYLYRIAQLVTLTSLHCGPVVNIYTDIMCRNTLIADTYIYMHTLPHMHTYTYTYTQHKKKKCNIYL